MQTSQFIPHQLPIPQRSLLSFQYKNNHQQFDQKKSNVDPNNIFQKNDISTTIITITTHQRLLSSSINKASHLTSTSLINKFNMTPTNAQVQAMHHISLSRLIGKEANLTEWFKGRIVCSKEKNTLYYRFHREEDNMLLMTAVKSGYWNYDIFIGNCINSIRRYKNHKVGVIKSNITKSGYHLYDGDRKEIGVIEYEWNLFGLKGPSQLIATFDNDRYILRNKQPNYSPKFNCYTLKYVNRRIQKSIKNFQLIQANNTPTQDIIFQFGKSNNDHSYICDFKSPLTPLKAFEIGIIADIPKFFCE